MSITDPRFDEHFGFTDDEVKRLLADYQLDEHFDETKQWYDGYRFGNVDVYCPWDVINHVDLLCSQPDWLILSNAESGEGFCDILIEPEDPDMGIVIEVKYAADMAKLDGCAAKALEQISALRYDERLRNDGRDNIMMYGISFCKKRCRVVCEAGKT